jgi:hypothetical protein
MTVPQQRKVLRGGPLGVQSLEDAMNGAMKTRTMRKMTAVTGSPTRLGALLVVLYPTLTTPTPLSQDDVDVRNDDDGDNRGKSC